MTSPNTDIVYYYYITACRHRYFMYYITMCFFINIYHHIQKSLKIPKGQSESYTVKVLIFAYFEEDVRQRK